MIINYRISIIIPCYNIATHIGQCIDSVLAQSYPHFELLLIDDGSMDDTLVICQEFAKKEDRIKVFSHENKGVSYTRNRGVGLATGEWIIFIDGDDYIKPDYIESLANNCEQNVWTLCGMINVRQGIEKENENYKQLLRHFPNRRIEKSDFLSLLKFYSYSSPWAKIYFRPIIIQNSITFPENVSYQEDLLFNIEYSKYIDAVKLVDYFGYYYIEHPTSSTGRYHQNFNHIDQLYDELKKYVHSEKDKEVLQEFILQTCVRNISNIFHKNSPKTEKQKKEEIKAIFNSNYYNYSKDYIDQLPVNYVLKLLLRLRSVKFIYLYFKILHD